MKKIKGNRELIATLENMAVSGRTPHAVLFYGEKGTGRKLMAEYYTMLLLCTHHKNGKPCGECKSCRNVERRSHPDLLIVPKSGKLGGYSVETARSVISDAYIRPNNSSGKKVYIFADCNDIDHRTQDALLKIIEEPPYHAYFIFTAESKSDFLPTIISRCVCFGVSACTEDEVRESLSDEGVFTQEEISSAISCFHGNIGMCSSYLRDEGLRRQVDLTKSLADSIIRGDEYSLNASFFQLGKDRADVKAVLNMLDRLLRDSAVLSENSSAALIGCYRDGAVRLSKVITPYQAAGIHRKIEKAWRAVGSNVNIPLVLAALSAEIIGSVNGFYNK